MASMGAVDSATAAVRRSQSDGLRRTEAPMPTLKRFFGCVSSASGHLATIYPGSGVPAYCAGDHDVVFPPGTYLMRIYYGVNCAPFPDTT